MDKKLTIELTQEQLENLAKMIAVGKITLEMSAKAAGPREDLALIKKQAKQAAQELREKEVAAYLMLPENKFWENVSWNECMKHLSGKSKREEDTILSKGKTKVAFIELNGRSKSSHKAGKVLGKKQMKLVKAFRKTYGVSKKEMKQTKYIYVKTDFNGQVFSYLKEAVNVAKTNGHNSLAYDKLSDAETTSEKIGTAWINAVINKIVDNQGENLEYDDELLFVEADMVIRDYVAAKRAGPSEAYFLSLINGAIYFISDVYDEISEDSYELIVGNI